MNNSSIILGIIIAFAIYETAQTYRLYKYKALYRRAVEKYGELTDREKTESRWIGFFLAGSSLIISTIIFIGMHLVVNFAN